MHDATATQVAYLGPSGTFTHQAAMQFIPATAQLVPCRNVGEVFDALATGQVDYGVAAIDNTVEGPVFATIDGLLAHPTVVAVADIWLPIQFDAYALAQSAANHDYQYGVAHPHALAQVTRALREFDVKPMTAESNGAALANLKPGQLAFGPPGYAAEGVVTVARNVGDYPDAATQFVLLSPRAQFRPASYPNAAKTLLAITPTDTGPGVLARISALFANANLNLSALFSRPIKGVAGQYVFIVTVDASPASSTLTSVISELEKAKDKVQQLGATVGRVA